MKCLARCIHVQEQGDRKTCGKYGVVLCMKTDSCWETPPRLGLCRDHNPGKEISVFVNWTMALSHKLEAAGVIGEKDGDGFIKCWLMSGRCEGVGHGTSPQEAASEAVLQLVRSLDARARRAGGRFESQTG